MATLTDTEIQALEAYIKAMGELKDVEPPMFLDMEHDANTNPAWENWNKQCVELVDANRDIIIKALKYDAGEREQGKGYPVDEIIQGVIALLKTDRHTFSTIRQGAATNQLTKIRATELNTKLDMLGNAEIKGDANFKVSFANFEELGGLKTSTYKLLDALTVQFTESGAKSRHIQIPLSEYMNTCGLKDRKEARKQVQADLNTLGAAALTFTDNSRGAKNSFTRLNMFSVVQLGRDAIKASFTEEFYSLIIGYPVMPYPEELWRLNSRLNPNSYYLMRRISEHKNMNFDKSNADLISVTTLLKACPYIPTYKEVNAKDRAFTRRIIEPFERDLTACKNVFSWEYCHSNNEPLTDAELQGFSYELFKTLLVHITWDNYPDMSKRLEAKKARAQKAASKTTKKGVTNSKKGGSKQQKRG